MKNSYVICFCFLVNSICFFRNSLQMKMSSSKIISLNTHTIIDLSSRCSSSSSSKNSSDRTWFYYLMIYCLPILLAIFCCLTIDEFQMRSVQFMNSSKFNFAVRVLLCMLTILLIILEKFSLPRIFNGHSHHIRFESAAVFGLLALELLQIFEKSLMNISDHGPLVDFIYQIGLSTMLSVRYFPILILFERDIYSSNRLGNVLCFSLGSIYFYCQIFVQLLSDIQRSVRQENRLGNRFRYFLSYYYLIFLALRLTLISIETFGKTCKSSFPSTSNYQYVKVNLLQNNVKFSHSFLCHSIYSIRPYFRYSKLIICLYISALTIVYSLTISIENYSFIFSWINFILCRQTNPFVKMCSSSNIESLHRDLQYLCLFTGMIVSLQLFFSFKHYQTQLCHLYRGQLLDIPSVNHLSSLTILSNSMHYPGRLIGKRLCSRNSSYHVLLFFRFINNKLCSLICISVDILCVRTFESFLMDSWARCSVDFFPADYFPCISFVCRLYSMQILLFKSIMD